VTLRAKDFEVQKHRKFGLLQFTLKNFYISLCGNNHIPVDGVSVYKSLYY